VTVPSDMRRGTAGHGKTYRIIPSQRSIGPKTSRHLHDFLFFVGRERKDVRIVPFRQIGPGLLCWLIVLRPLPTVLCLRSGTPGGLFTPTMTLGAMVGDGMGRMWNPFASGTKLRAMP
jgi:H+/Cl- antiporter ClcA